jgi:Fe-S-cluster containining protein
MSIRQKWQPRNHWPRLPGLPRLVYRVAMDTAPIVHFACTACGKCCTSPPVMAVGEALALYRDFALVLKLGGPIADANLPASNPGVQTYVAQRAHLTAQGAQTFDLYTGPTQHWEATLLAAAMPLRAAADDPCPALTTEGLCSLYDRRPTRCRMAPFDQWLPETMAIQAGAHRLQEAVRQDWACDLSESAPVVAQDGHFTTDSPLRTAFDDSLAAMRRDDPVMALLGHSFQAQLKAQPDMVPEVIQRLARRETLDFSFPHILEALHRLAQEKDRPAGETSAILDRLPPLRDFVAAQIDLLEALVARNVARRRPQDRPSTDRLRGLVTQYREGLARME